MTSRWLPAPPAVAEAGAFPAGPRQLPVKVAHVITRFEAGAGGNTLLSAAGMDAERWQTWVVGGPGGPLWAKAEQAGVRTVVLPSLVREVAPRSDLRALLALVRLFRRERFDIVHVHSSKAAVLGRVAARLCGTPVVVYTVHGRDPWWPSSTGAVASAGDVGRGLAAFLTLERLLRRWTHRFVAVSPTVARDAVLAGIATAGRTDVAPSAIDMSAVPVDRVPGLRDRLGVPENATLVGTVGRVDSQKAPLDFVRMAGRVAQARPATQFVMVGDGALLDECRALAEQLGVPIVFTGHRDDAPRLAAAFDVFVVTSLYEGVGRSVTEAMASGRPVVATAVDGVVDLVSPGSTGLLAAAGDVPGLADAVTWMLDHPNEAAAMGRQARERVRRLFTPEGMCGVLDEIYSTLLGLEGAGGADGSGDVGTAGRDWNRLADPAPVVGGARG